MQIEAAVLHVVGAPRPYAESRPIRIERLDLAPPGPDEVLVRIEAAGLCHSDLSVMNGDRPRPVPMALGHEAAGVVEALGSGVPDLAKGDRVVMVFVPSCGHCGPCAEGRPALCEPGVAANGQGTLLSGARRLTFAGAPIHHHLGVSAFATHAVVSRRSLVRIDPDVPPAVAALFGCAVMTGVGAVVNTAAVKPGTTVAVVGLGGVGLAAVLGAVAAGAERILALDPLAAKRDLAVSLGATDAFDPADPGCVEAVKAATKGGVDTAFEMAGSAPALDLAYRITRRGGTTVTAGLANPAATLALPPVSLVVEERTLKGSYIGSCVPSRDIPRYVRMMQRGRLPVDRLMSGTLDLADINAGFDRLADGTAVRQVVTF
jgi:alcohol dehydrogenase